MKPYMARVTWNDASRTDDVVTGKEHIGVVRKTLGWVLRNDSTGVAVAMTKDVDGAAAVFERAFFIPRDYVVSVTRLAAQ